MRLTSGIGKTLRGGVALLLVACGWAWIGGTAKASLLTSGSTIPAASRADTGGTQEAQDLTASIVPNGPSGLVGSLTSTVDVNDPSNPYYSPSSPGELTFIFQIVDAAGSSSSLQTLSLNGFTGFSIDASYISAAGETAPVLISRPDSGGVDVVKFSFSPSSFGPGTTSTELVLHTNATQYTTSTAAVNGTGPLQGNAPTFQPVPEPSTVMLASLGMVFVVGCGLRRRRV